jgi:hypothetical protein
MDSTLIWTGAAGLAVTVLGGIVATVVVVRLPPDYFTRPDPAKGRIGSLGHKLGRVARNVAGVALIVGGVVLMLPGVPGPGIIVLLLGLSLTDVPGKRRVMQSLVRKPSVLRSLNRVRRRFHRPEFVLP